MYERDGTGKNGGRAHQRIGTNLHTTRTAVGHSWGRTSTAATTLALVRHPPTLDVVSPLTRSIAVLSGDRAPFPR